MFEEQALAAEHFDRLSVQLEAHTADGRELCQRIHDLSEAGEHGHAAAARFVLLGEVDRSDRALHLDPKEQRLIRDGRDEAGGLLFGGGSGNQFHHGRLGHLFGRRNVTADRRQILALHEEREHIDRLARYGRGGLLGGGGIGGAVSYTHLTLPTILRV